LMHGRNNNRSRWHEQNTMTGPWQCGNFLYLRGLLYLPNRSTAWKEVHGSKNSFFPHPGLVLIPYSEQNPKL
jgi:hypothetical protein